MFTSNVIPASKVDSNSLATAQDGTSLNLKLNKQRNSLLRNGQDFPRQEDLLRTFVRRNESSQDTTLGYSLVPKSGNILVVPVLATRSTLTAGKHRDLKINSKDEVGLYCAGFKNGELASTVIHLTRADGTTAASLEQQLVSRGFTGTLQPATQVNKYKVVPIEGVADTAIQGLYGREETLATEEIRVSLVNANGKTWLGRLNGPVDEVAGEIVTIGDDERQAASRSVLLAKWTQELHTLGTGRDLLPREEVLDR